MLDEDEFEQVAAVLSDCMRGAKSVREESGKSLKDVDHSDRFQPAFEAFQRITGFEETNHLAIYHHRISIYGPPCHKCSKPLRTPQAQQCAECGAAGDRFRDEVRIDTGRSASHRTFVRVVHLPSGLSAIQDGIEPRSWDEVVGELVEQLRRRVR